MLAFGMVSDEFGRKRVMLIGAGIFCAGSVLCALAPNVQTLIAGRAIMGFGAAASEPGTLSMLRHLYTDERSRDRAIGVWTVVSGLALALGSVIGGALIGLWTSIAGSAPPTVPGLPPGPNPDSWRAIFWFNVVFGLAALIAAIVVLPENADPDAHRVDISGTVLGAAALTAFTFAVIDAENDGFGAPSVIGVLRLLRPLRRVLLHRPVPLRGGQRDRIPDPPDLPADDRADDRRLAAGRPLDHHGRAGTVDLDWLPAVQRRPAADHRHAQPAPLVCTAGPGPGPGRHWRRHDGGPGDLLGAVRRATRALRHGRVGDEHEPRDRRGDRRGDPGRAGERPAQVQPDRQHERPAHPGHLPGDRHQDHRDRRSHRHQRTGRGRRGRGGAGQAHPGDDARRVQRVLHGAARRAARLGDPGLRRRRVRVRNAQPPAAARGDLTARARAAPGG